MLPDQGRHYCYWEYPGEVTILYLFFYSLYDVPFFIIFIFCIDKMNMFCYSLELTFYLKASTARLNGRNVELEGRDGLKGDGRKNSPQGSRMNSAIKKQEILCSRYYKRH